MSNIRTVVIGAGMIANAAHLQGIERIGSGYDVVAVADIRESAAKETAERFHIPNVYTDVEQMLKEQKPELAIVATPNAYHKEMSLLAMRYGANVICEKPVAMKYEDAVEMFAAAEKLGVQFFPAQTERFNIKRTAAKRIFDSGILGDIYFIELDTIRRRGIPKWGFFHMKEHNVGGPFCDLTVHEIDHMLYCLGNPKMLSVSGSTWQKIGNTDQQLEEDVTKAGALGGITITPRPYDWHEFSVEDMATGIIRLEGGITVNFKSSWALNLEERWSRSFCGTKAGMNYTNTTPMVIYGDMSNWQADFFPKVYPQGDYPADLPFPGHVGLLKNVYDVLRNNGTAVIKKEETLNVTAIIEAFYTSAELGREVTSEEIVK